MNKKTKILYAVALFFTSVFVVSAWTGPTGAPPTQNTLGPINVGPAAQNKFGALSIGFSSAPTSNAILNVNGGIKFGNQDTCNNANAGTQRYASGSMEYCDGSTWVDFIPTTTPTSGLWTASGANIYNSNTGNVAIGTTTPTSKLDVRGDIGGTSVGFSSVDATSPYGVFIAAPFTNTLGLYTNATERMRLSANGKVGIGTSTNVIPMTLTIAQSTPTTPATYFSYALGINNENGVATLNLGADANNAYIQSFNAKPLHINSAGNDIFIAEGTGRVGIGTNDPSAKLHVKNGGIKTETLTSYANSSIATIDNSTLVLGYPGSASSTPAPSGSGPSLGSLQKESNLASILGAKKADAWIDPPAGGDCDGVPAECVTSTWNGTGGGCGTGVLCSTICSDIAAAPDQFYGQCIVTGGGTGGTTNNPGTGNTLFTGGTGTSSPTAPPPPDKLKVYGNSSFYGDVAISGKLFVNGTQVGGSGGYSSSIVNGTADHANGSTTLSNYKPIGYPGEVVVDDPLYVSNNFNATSIFGNSLDIAGTVVLEGSSYFAFGGMFTLVAGITPPSTNMAQCAIANPYATGCACPSGFTALRMGQVFSQSALVVSPSTMPDANVWMCYK